MTPNDQTSLRLFWTEARGVHVYPADHAFLHGFVDNETDQAPTDLDAAALSLATDLEITAAMSRTNSLT